MEQEVRRDLRKLKDLGVPKVSGKKLIPALLCFVLAVVCAGVYTATEMLPFIIAAGVLCLAAVPLMMGYSRARQAVQQAQEQRRQILKKYRATSPEEIGGALRSFRARYEAVLAAEKQEKLARSAYESSTKQQTDLEENAIAELDFSGGSSEAAQLSRALAAKRAQVEQISSNMAMIRGRLSAIGDPLVLASSLTCMLVEYETI